MVQACRVLKISSVDTELGEGVQFALHSVLGRPRVAGTAFQDKHPMIDGRTSVVAEHFYLWRRRIEVRIGSEDNVPFVVDYM